MSTYAIVMLVGIGSCGAAFAYLIFRVAQAVRALEGLYIARAKTEAQRP